MIGFLAQTVTDASAVPFDWQKVALVFAMPLMFTLGHKVGAWGIAAVRAKLASSGHPQAAQAFDLLVSAFAAAATEAEKDALAKKADAAGVDHPAIDAATK